MTEKQLRSIQQPQSRSRSFCIMSTALHGVLVRMQLCATNVTPVRAHAPTVPCLWCATNVTLHAPLRLMCPAYGVCR